MSLELGIVGLPNVGKSTLFKAITSQNVDASNYPFCTIEPNIGIVKVPDANLDFLTKTFESDNTVHNVLRIVDIAGLVRGASKGEGLGNKFLDHIRQVDAIMEVVRCFTDKNVTHVDSSVDAMRDLETISQELLFSDLELIERNLDKQKKQSKGGPASNKDISLLEALYKHVGEGKWLNKFEITDEEQLEFYQQIPFLTSKPLFIVLNIDEDLNTDNPSCQSVIEYSKKNNIPLLTICAKIEAEISELNDEDKNAMLADLGLKKSGLSSIIELGFSKLNQIIYYTAGKQEVRAWNIAQDSVLPKAAGKIHTDLERGFIRGEVYNIKDLLTLKSEVALKSAGKIRIEGKNYIVKDGDVVHIRFAV